VLGKETQLNLDFDREETEQLGNAGKGAEAVIAQGEKKGRQTEASSTY